MSTVPDEPGGPAQNRKRHVLRLGGHEISLPRSRALRMVLGGGLVAGGVFSFLPVLGVWMLPLGAMVLSVDLPPVRRLRRRTEVWWGRSDARKQADGSWAWTRRQLKRVWPKRGG